MADRARAAGVNLDRPTLVQLQADLGTADGHLAHLRDLLASDPLVGLARSFPPTRDAIRGADAVVAAGGDLTGAAADGLTIADQYVTIREAQAATASGTGSSTTGGSALAGLVELMATSQSSVNAAIGALDRADQALAAAPADLPGPIADARDTMRAKIAEFGPPLKAYAQAAAILPEILGWNGPRRYLVLTQDPAELRPTGGFIGSFGILAFDKGRITERHFQDVFLLDLPWKYPFITAPGPLSGYLLGPKQPWQLADSNWSPDFPTSAADAIRLYKNEGGSGQIDGVLGLTTYTIDQLLTLTGPITVPEYGATVASGETTLKVLQLTRAPQAPNQNRKAFLSTFADHLFGTLLGLPPQKWADLAGQADLFRTQRLFTAWFADPGAEALTVGAGFDGAVLQSTGDYIYPVDSNVAPVSKLNAVTDRALDLSVQLDPVGDAHDNLDIAWTNQIQTELGAPYRALPTLGDLRVLGMYFRLLVPDRSRIGTVSGGSYQRPHGTRGYRDGGRPGGLRQLPPRSRGHHPPRLHLGEPVRRGQRGRWDVHVPPHDPETARSASGTAPPGDHPAAGCRPRGRERRPHRPRWHGHPRHHLRPGSRPRHPLSDARRDTVGRRSGHILSGWTPEATSACSATGPGSSSRASSWPAEPPTS